MTKVSRSCRLFLEVDLFHALPAMYRDGFMEHTYTILYIVLYYIYSNAFFPK